MRPTISRAHLMLRSTLARMVAALLVMALATFGRLHSATESYTGSALSGAALVVGAMVNGVDPKFSQIGTGVFNVAGASATLRLRLKEEDGLYHPAKFTVTVDLSVQSWNASNASSTTTTRLVVEYDPAAGQKHQDQNVYRVPGAHKVVGTITAITAVDATNTPIPIVPNDIVLDAGIDVERYYTFDPTAQPLLQSLVNTTIGTDRGSVEITWQHVDGAEEYDLEWSIVGAEDAAGNLISAANVSYDFRHNATRITTTDTRYTLNRVFERSWIVFRIRGVGRDIANPAQRIEGAWSLLPRSGGVSSAVSANHAFSGGFHEERMNWRYTASFAEEGKRKEVVEYYDGTLRKRQAVTLLSTVNRTVVGESVPDNAGRPAVEILPAPTSESILHFYSAFNLSTAAGNPSYSRKDFDLEPGECAHPAEAIASSSGAGRYYSPSNPDQFGMNAFIPDAQGYPFVQTSYTLDNTGRVRSQSGAGLDHRLTSGHETRYYYGTPFQEDLDRLFGSDVGYNVHYKKNLTLDANGQVSIAYLDPAGRTIATSLAGRSPQNLQALPSNTGGEERTIDLMGTNTVDNEESTALNTHLVTSNNLQHAFEYTLKPPTLTDACAPAECFDCVYDLTISVRNECGTELIPGGTINQLVGSPIDGSCSGANVAHTFDMPLSIGSHPILKTLRLNDSAISLYIDRYIAANTCLKTHADFLAEYMANIDYSGCGGDYCAEECADELGPDPTISSSTSGGEVKKLGPAAAYNKAMADCLADCEAYDPCEAGYELMLADVRPGGQYGTTTPNGDGTYGDILSVFNENNNIHGVGNDFDGNTTLGLKSWRHPDPPYHDADGNSSQVVNSQGVLVNPEALSFSEFMENWQDSWAESLVKYHPEYCFYEWCVANKASNDYDGKLLGAETCAEATAAGLLPDPFLADPYFAAGGRGAGLRPGMQSEVAAFKGSPYSMKELAVIQVHCGNCDPLDAAQLKACIQAHPFGTDPATCDDEWIALRSIYLATKQGFVESHRLGELLSIGSPCGTWINAIGSQTHVVQFDFTQTGGGLNWSTQTIYWSKTRRYQTAIATIGSAGTDPATAPGAMRDSLVVLCARQCEGYADVWMGKLAACRSSYPNWATDSVAIRNELIEVCKKGCDECNIFGSSTTKPGAYANAPHNDDSFDDVLRRHFGSNYANANCNAGLITMPMAYGHNYLGVPPDPYDCGCAGRTGGTTCLPCDSVTAIFDAISHQNPRYPGETSGAYQERLAAAMNNRLSFNLTWMEYADFIQGCNGAAGGGNGQVTCDSVTAAGRALFSFLDAVARTDQGLTPPQGVMISSIPSLAAIYNGSPLAAAVAASGNKCSTPIYRTCTDARHAFTCDATHLHITIAGSTGEEIEGGCHCDIDLVLPNAAHRFSEVAGFTGIRPDPSTVDAAGVCRGFIITARMDDGTIVDVKGSSSCIEIALCRRESVPCPEDLIDETGPILGGGRLPSGVGTKWTTPVNVVEGGRYIFSADVRAESGSKLPASPIVLTIDGKPVELRLVAPGGVPSRVEGSWQAGRGGAVRFELRYREMGLERMPAISNVMLQPVDCGEKLCNTNIFDMDPPADPCREMLEEQARVNAERAYNEYIDSVKNDFRRRYVSACMALEGKETFTMTYTENEYHFTLYYYDQGGNLVQTVPPAGVVPLTSASDLALASSHRKNPSSTAPTIAHTLVTRYWYNSLNQLTRQRTPDGGATTFLYDRLGRLVISQSARQAVSSLYSYTRFDHLGRIIEVGQVKPSAAPTAQTPKNDVVLANWIGGGIRTEITRTQYDESLPGVAAWFGGAGQENLRGRVASAVYIEMGSTYRSATHYSYDVHGNVKTLIQENREMPAGHEQKRVDYRFDLVSGNVNAVDYQAGQLDQFHHRYEYDADNRVIQVSTSSDSVIWNRDAEYFYYLHGPLARVEIGDAKVQGMDYAYTIQGWIKGVNSNTLRSDRDMGGDGTTTSGHLFVGRDEFGYSLGYFTGDYKPIGTASFEASTSGSSFGTDGPSLYNGNIRHMVTAIGSFMQNNAAPQGTAYRYDQLNRLIEMKAHRGLDPNTNAWGSAPAVQDYHTELSYDPNGNILTHDRWGAGSNMDELTYHYLPNTNQLDHVDDPVSSTNYTEDIDQQGSGNYAYDPSGNLIKDVESGITGIAWTVYGKVKSVTKPSQTIEFRYDPSGNRIAKIVGSDSTRYYVRDASGNVMATYVLKGSAFRLDDQTIYGSTRVGEHRRELDLSLPATPNIYSRIRGESLYELANHLGNVHSVVTDRKIPNGTTGNLLVDWYVADVASAVDSYAGGQSMPLRRFDHLGYPFGSANGQERVDEINGNGEHYTALFWEYDPRLMRRWNRDPKPDPSISEYTCYAANPVRNLDVLGDSTWVTQSADKLVINTTIEFSGSGLYNKKGELRDGADATIDQIKKDIISRWSGAQYENRHVEVNLITKSSKDGGTEPSYDQITVKQGGGRSFIRITDKNGTRVSNRNQINIIRQIRAGSNDYNVTGTFYRNSATGTFAHEYGHMIGYWAEDYIEGKFDALGMPVPTEPWMNKSIMNTTFGIPLPHVFQRIFSVNTPVEQK